MYEYLLESNTFLHLTDGPDQAYDPMWSPHGQWIVHAAARTFGTGAGISVSGFFAARPDGSGVISLYDPSEYSGGEQGIGWLNDHTLVAHSWFITCGPSDLRLVDLTAQKADRIFEGCLSAAAAGWGSVLFAQSPDTASFDEYPRPGLFLITEADRSPRLISDADIREIVWMEGSGNYLALAADNRLYEVSPSGGIRVLLENQFPIPTVSPDARYWALSDSDYFDSPRGVWIGEYGQALRQVFTENISPNQILFMPPGNIVYFLDAAGNLYYALAPEWVPVLITANLQPASSELSMALVLNDKWVF